MPKPRTHARKAPSAYRRISQKATAAESFADFGPGVELDVLTFGQFSLIDALDALLDITGPARVALVTWTSADFDLAQIEAQIGRSAITEFRLLTDRSFPKRKPQFVRTIMQRFGKDAIRTTKTHAKWITITNDAWTVTVRTSMNLNYNPRLEYLQVSTDPELHDFYAAITDAVWADAAEGLTEAGLPDLEGLAGMMVETTPPPVRMGEPPRMGTPPRVGPSASDAG
jgi:hypothetical protein